MFRRSAISARPRLPARLVRKLVARSLHLSQEIDNVDGQANRASLVGDRSRNGLTDPPVHVGGEAEAALWIVFVDAAIEPEIALLNEIQEGHAPANVAACHTDNKPQVGLDEPSARCPADSRYLLEIGAGRSLSDTSLELFFGLSPGAHVRASDISSRRRKKSSLADLAQIQNRRRSRRELHGQCVATLRLAGLLSASTPSGCMPITSTCSSTFSRTLSSVLDQARIGALPGSTDVESIVLDIAFYGNSTLLESLNRKSGVWRRAGIGGGDDLRKGCVRSIWVFSSTARFENFPIHQTGPHRHESTCQNESWSAPWCYLRGRRPNFGQSKTARFVP